MAKGVVKSSIEHPVITVIIVLIVSFLFATQFPKMKVDTDPENMLEKDEYVRVFHNQVKEDFNIHDKLVLGIVNEKGAFNPETLNKTAEIIDKILQIEGVEKADFISPTTTNNVITEGGTMVVNRMMVKVPATQKEADDLFEMVRDNPLFADKLISSDGKAIAIYIPIEKKDQSYRISQEIEEILSGYQGDEKFYIAGLPVAEDTFGIEMFKQMGMSAPMAMLIMLIIMLIFFRRLSLVIPPLFVAMFSVFWAMGFLIGMGFSVHIMSSMIPIFLMPIAVVDSVHILSEFHDRYPRYRDRKQTLQVVMEELFRPMLFTSLTSAVGFASLALAPIPPVRVFGLFVAFGIMAAWLMTVTFIPAAIMLTREKWLQRGLDKREEAPSPIHRLMNAFGRVSVLKVKTTMTVMIVLLAIGVYGISRIVVNDNPVNWFHKDHRIRVADRVLNEHFGGTYMAYLVLTGQEDDAIKDPATLSYMERLQQRLEKMEVVGKASSLVDVVKRVNYVVHGEDAAYNVLPASREEIAQYLFLFLASADDPDEMDNYVDYNYSMANIWLQMKEGNNRDMQKVEAVVDDFVRQNPLPPGIKLDWAGLTYLNVVWQQKMVVGMLKALLGSFVVVLILMTILFRSIRWGLVSMLPLTFTIVLTYGMIGLAGKEYDMPVAVLSSLSLGLSIDFAIHFIQRLRARLAEGIGLEKAFEGIFGEPARAIFRNALVIAIGFSPLLFAPLTPYQTVGGFLASIMMLSAVATLLLMPGLIKTFIKSTNT
jgi:hypothetical protein